jgi:hypothetical protein
MKPGSRFMSWRGSFGSGTTEGPHRSAMPKEQPRAGEPAGREYPVTIEIEGKRYTGFYTVNSGVVTVASDWGERISPAGPTAARTARLLFSEILFTAMACSKRA